MKKILDIGCGSGELINSLNNKERSEIWGIDISSENINKCIKNNKYKNTFFKIGVGEKLEFKEDYFDEIYCMEVLEHVNNLEKTIHEIKRVLKGNGKLTISVPLKDSEVILGKLNPDYFKQIGHKRFFSKQDIIRILKENKFKIKKYTAYNSIEHIYWRYAFKKGRKITSQLGVIDKKLPRIMRILVMALSREIVQLRKNTKNPIHYIAILILHLGYPFGLLLDSICTNKKQKVSCINKK